MKKLHKFWLLILSVAVLFGLMVIAQRIYAAYTISSQGYVYQEDGTNNSYSRGTVAISAAATSTVITNVATIEVAVCGLQYDAPGSAANCSHLLCTKNSTYDNRLDVACPSGVGTATVHFMVYGKGTVH